MGVQTEWPSNGTKVKEVGVSEKRIRLGGLYWYPPRQLAKMIEQLRHIRI